MEGKSVKPIALVMFMSLFVLGMMFVEQASASSSDEQEGCYLQCFMLCRHTEDPDACRSDCIKHCHQQTAPSDLDDLHYYCQMGCASSACTDISADEVKPCVNSCSNKCAKKF